MLKFTDIPAEVICNYMPTDCYQVVLVNKDLYVNKDPEKYKIYRIKQNIPELVNCLQNIYLYSHDHVKYIDMQLHTNDLTESIILYLKQYYYSVENMNEPKYCNPNIYPYLIKLVDCIVLFNNCTFKDIIDIFRIVYDFIDYFKIE